MRSSIASKVRRQLPVLTLRAQVMKRLARDYPALDVMLHTTIGERLSLTELPRGMSFGQQLLRNLRTSKAEMELEHS